MSKRKNQSGNDVMPQSPTRSTVNSLKPFSHPRSVAVIGASRNRTNIGYRGQPPADIKAIEDILLRISYLVEEVPAIVELDRNPIFALPPRQDCRIVDARLRVRVS